MRKEARGGLEFDGFGHVRCGNAEVRETPLAVLVMCFVQLFDDQVSYFIPLLSLLIINIKNALEIVLD